jgi:restriction system protein
LSPITPEVAKRVLAWLGYEDVRTHSLNLADKLRSMAGPEFEEFVAQLFRRKGYLVELTETTGDHGIDLLMHLDGKRTIVQCKRWSDSVGEPVIRDFFGAMVNSQAQFGFVVTTSHFSRQAVAFAEGKPITLVDIDSLLAMCCEAESSVEN